MISANVHPDNHSGQEPELAAFLRWQGRVGLYQSMGIEPESAWRGSSWSMVIWRMLVVTCGPSVSEVGQLTETNLSKTKPATWPREWAGAILNQYYNSEAYRHAHNSSLRQDT